MPDLFQIISLASVVATLCLLLYLVSEQRRYFRLNQERFRLQTERMDVHNLRLLRLERTRQSRERLIQENEG